MKLERPVPRMRSDGAYDDVQFRTGFKAPCRVFTGFLRKRAVAAERISASKLILNLTVTKNVSFKFFTFRFKLGSLNLILYVESKKDLEFAFFMLKLSYSTSSSGQSGVSTVVECTLHARGVACSIPGWVEQILPERRLYSVFIGCWHPIYDPF